MGRDELFKDLPEVLGPKRAAEGGPRLREPERDQIELRAVDLDSLIGADHAARVIWAYVEQLDLSALEEAVRAREHTPGQAPASPRLLLALWLYATSQGVGSARALARLCESHDAYRWLCGGVSVNYHGLADFRSGQGELLDALLIENVATLSAPARTASSTRTAWMAGMSSTASRAPRAMSSTWTRCSTISGSMRIGPGGSRSTRSRAALMQPSP